MSNHPTPSQEGNDDYHSPRTPSCAPHFAEHHTHYYPDGNIILLAGQTKFRVFRFILAQKSIVFRDMFDAIPASSDSNRGQFEAQNMVDGIAAVELEDCEEDMERLLDAIFPSSIFSPLPSTEDTYSLLNVFDKFECTMLWKEAAVAALKPFPRTLEDFQKDPELQCYDNIAKVARVLRLARSLDDSTVLPLACYALMIRDLSVDDPEAGEEPSGTLALSDIYKLLNGKSAVTHALIVGLAQAAPKNRNCRTNIQHLNGRTVACSLYGKPIIGVTEFSCFTRNPLGEMWKRSSLDKCCEVCKALLGGEMHNLSVTLFDVLQVQFAKI